MSTAKELKVRITLAEGKAVENSLACDKIIRNEGLGAAMEFCKSKGIEPPQCSLTAKSPNADNQREKAVKMLSESAWWKRRLRNQAKQVFEHEQITAGNVSNAISDASFEYDKANRN